MVRESIPYDILKSVNIESIYARRSYVADGKGETREGAEGVEVVACQ